MLAKLTVWASFCLAASSAFSQQGVTPVSRSFDSTATHLKQQDDVENFIYLLLDLYLTDPSQEQLIIFDQYEKSVWRPLHSEGERLAYVTLLCNKGYYLNRFGEIHAST